MDVELTVLNRERVWVSFEKDDPGLSLYVSDGHGGTVKVNTCYAILSDLLVALDSVLEEWRRNVKSEKRV